MRKDFESSPHHTAFSGHAVSLLDDLSKKHNRMPGSWCLRNPSVEGRNSGRAGEIRTHDLLHPMQAFYQAELRPDLLAGQRQAVRLGRRMMAGTTLFATDLFSMKQNYARLPRSIPWAMNTTPMSTMNREKNCPRVMPRIASDPESGWRSDSREMRATA